MSIGKLENTLKQCVAIVFPIVCFDIFDISCMILQTTYGMILCLLIVQKVPGDDFTPEVIIP